MRSIHKDVVGAALAVMLVPAPAAAECLKWDVSGKAVTLNQSLGGFASFDLAVDGGNVTGSARTGRGELVNLLNVIWQGEYYERAGEVDGVFDGNRLELQVHWTDGKIGIYTLDIDERGRLSGSTYDFERPSFRANILGDKRLECAVAAPLPPPAPPPPPRAITTRDATTTGVSRMPTPVLVQPKPRITKPIGKRQPPPVVIVPQMKVRLP